MTDDAQEAKLVYSYKNIKENLHKTNASIWFNKILKIEQLTLKYIHVSVIGNDQKSTNTKNAAIKYRLNQELKYLYKKTSTQCTIVQNPFRMCR